MSIRTKFSIQEHWTKKNRTIHLDLRVLNPRRNKLWSWAFPKAKFPENKEKILAIRTPDHKVNYMYFSGRLNNGDKVKLYDKGMCTILVDRNYLKIMSFMGKNINGTYNFIRISSSKKNDSWLVTKSKT